jgi:hypothetical protein
VTAAPRGGVLEPFRARVRRFQLIVGIGVLAVIIGAVVAPVLLLRLVPLMSRPSAGWLVLFTVMGQLWVWAVMPLLLYATARVVEVRPWSAPVGAAATGMFFVLALGYITGGLESLTGEHPARLATLLLTAVGGVFLGRLAIVSARAAVDRRQREAQAAAEARKGEYDQFAREAERLAALHSPPDPVKPREAAEPPASPGEPPRET